MPSNLATHLQPIKSPTTVARKSGLIIPTDPPFKAKFDGTSDDTGAIMDALSAGDVFIPPVGVALTGNLNIAVERNLIGFSKRAGGSHLRYAHADGDHITISANGPSSVRGLYLDTAKNRTSGATIKATGVGRYTIADNQIWNGFDAIVSDCQHFTTISGNIIFSTSRRAISFKSGLLNYLTNNYVDNSATQQSAAGLWVSGGIIGDLTSHGNQYIHCGMPLYVEALPGQAITSLNLNQDYYDNSSGPSIIRANGGTIARVDMTAVWFGSHGGLRLEQQNGGIFDGASIEAARIVLNAGTGLTLNGVVKNIRLMNPAISQNSGAGIEVGKDSELDIFGGVIGAGDGLLGNYIGIQINQGSKGSMIGGKVEGNNISQIDNRSKKSFHINVRTE